MSQPIEPAADLTTPIDDAPASEKPRLRAISLAVAALLGLLYAYAIWAAIGNAIRYSSAYGEIDQPAPWWLFAIGILVPVVIYLLGFIYARRRPILDLFVVLFTGYAVTAALGLGLIALNQVLFTNLVFSLR